MAVKQIKFIRRQRGVALFISLVVLLIITIVGVSAVQTTTLEERMAANARDRGIAFQAAEAALLSAENFIEDLEPADMPAFLGNANGLYMPANPGDVTRWDEVDWEGDASLPQTDEDLPGVYDQPRYIVERLTHGRPASAHPIVRLLPKSIARQVTPGDPGLSTAGPATAPRGRDPL